MTPQGINLDEQWEAFLGEIELARPQAETDAAHDAYLDRLLEMAGDQQEELDRIEEMKRLRIAQINTWAADQGAMYRRRLEKIEQELMLASETMTPEPKKKTRSLPHGDVGKRKAPDRVEIEDEAKAIAFCKQHNIKIAIKEEARKKPLAEYAQKNGGRLPADSGARYVKGQDEFTYTVKRHGQR